MQEEYVEEKSSTGTVVRVNNQKGTFIVIRGEEALPNPFVPEKSIIHPLVKVAFVGPDFKPDLRDFEETAFFQVRSGYMKVPFRISEGSDVRHVSISTPLDVDLLPARIYHLPNHQSATVRKQDFASLYFIVNSRTDKEAIIRLKTLYPGSRIILYGGEADKKVETAAPKFGEKSPDRIRATDLIQHRDLSDLSLNPTFAARVYLRRLEWNSMRDLPFKVVFEPLDVSNILNFLNIMLINADGKEELRKNQASIKTLKSFYDLLAIFLSLDIGKVESFLKKGTPPPQFLTALRKILEAQQKLRREANLGGEDAFFSSVTDKLTAVSADK